jgi:hypothetical protein
MVTFFSFSQVMVASTPSWCICRSHGSGGFGSVSTVSVVHLEKESNWTWYISASRCACTRAGNAAHLIYFSTFQNLKVISDFDSLIFSLDEGE